MNLETSRRGKGQRKIVVDVNPEIADDASVLNSKNTHVVLNEVLTNTQKWVNDKQNSSLKDELFEEIKAYRRDYGKMVRMYNFEMEKVDNSLTSLEFIQNQKLKKKNGHIDFNFVKG